MGQRVVLMPVLRMCFRDSAWRAHKHGKNGENGYG